MNNNPFGMQADVLGKISGDWARWMQSVNAQELIVEVEVVGRRARCTSRALKQDRWRRRPVWKENELPVELARQTLDLRAAMAHPKGGAWTWARLSMASDNYRLVSDFDYDRRPELTPAVTAQDCEDELRNFPREPGAIPDWMRPAT